MLSMELIYYRTYRYRETHQRLSMRWHIKISILMSITPSLTIRIPSNPHLNGGDISAIVITNKMKITIVNIKTHYVISINVYPLMISIHSWICITIHHSGNVIYVVNTSLTITNPLSIESITTSDMSSLTVNSLAKYVIRCARTLILK